jgi:hypothetical protein
VCLVTEWKVVWCSGLCSCVCVCSVIDRLESGLVQWSVQLCLCVFGDREESGLV